MVRRKAVKKKGGESHHSTTDILHTYITRFAQSHTLFTFFFAPVLLTLCPPGYGFGS